MGPSGAGKSTLLNTLSGRVNGAVATLARGRVTANGVPIATTSDFAKFGTVAPQDDVLLPALTTFELLDFAAKLRGSTPGRVEALLTAFELAERRDLASASLSGGQRKRLSIAMEVVHSPAVLLVDEPTSGLDARVAYATLTRATTSPSPSKPQVPSYNATPNQHTHGTKRNHESRHCTSHAELHAPPVDQTPTPRLHVVAILGGMARKTKTTVVATIHQCAPAHAVARACVGWTPRYTTSVGSLRACVV
mmetsp:Transcript_25208/g.100341  ORF Transcript_25208/g.100341 Transcript_25208/m.100341 type:complete len:250 (+) Transcript_25208:433-1182(+)